MGNAQQPNACKADISEDFEISSSSYLIKNNEIWADKENDFRGLLEVAFQRRILRDSICKLEVTRRFHRLDHRTRFGVQVFRNRLCEGGFSRPRPSTNEHPSVVVS